MGPYLCQHCDITRPVQSKPCHLYGMGQYVHIRFKYKIYSTFCVNIQSVSLTETWIPIYSSIISSHHVLNSAMNTAWHFHPSSQETLDHCLPSKLNDPHHILECVWMFSRYFPLFEFSQDDGWERIFYMCSISYLVEGSERVSGESTTLTHTHTQEERLHITI